MSSVTRFQPSHDDIVSLSKWDLKEQIIGFRSDSKGNREIVLLSKLDVSFKQKFLRCFGRGKLANVEINLTKVASILAQTNWTCIIHSGARADSDEMKAYSKTCLLANKLFLAKGDSTLLNSVGTELKIESAYLTQIRKKNKTFTEIKPSVRWNPEMEFKHINVQLQKIFHNSTVRIEIADRDECELPSDSPVYPVKDFSELTFQVQQNLK